MKKKILAVVLAAATAFSMFGASLSASAAALKAVPDVDAAKLVADKIDVTDYKATYDDKDYADYDEFIEDMEAVQALIEDDETVIPSAAKIYSYNYTVKTWEDFLDTLDAALATVENESAGFISVYEGQANAVIKAAAALVPEKNADYTISDLRKELLNEYAAARADVELMDDSDYNLPDAATDGNYDKTDLALVKSWFAGNGYAYANSQLVYILAKYSQFIEDVDLADADDIFEKLEAAIEEAEEIVAYRNTEYKDTTAANRAFDQLEKYIDAAYDVLYDYSVTNSKVKTATTNLNNQIAKMAQYAIPADANAKAALKAAIAKADACKEDTGYDTTSDTAAVKAFNKAYDAAKAVQTNDAQHVYETATENLTDAIDGLKVTPARPSYVLQVEEDLTKAGAFNLVESDYTATSWKKYDAAMAKYEEAVTTKEYAAAQEAVEAAVTGLVKVSTRAAKAEFNAVYKEAQALLKDKDLKAEKSVAAYDAFDAAVTKAGKVKTDAATVSELEDATAALEKAIEAYKNNKVVEAFDGWNFVKGEGWYFYKDGEKVTGWYYDEVEYNSWFYFDANGKMKTGWLWDANYQSWYYLKSNGFMAKNEWVKDGNAWYYLTASGAMAKNTTINGYKVDASGKWVA